MSMDCLQAGILGASAADLLTTEWAMQQPGLMEANPMLREPAARFVLKAAGTAAVWGSYRALRKRGKHKAAKIVAWTAIALWSGAAVNNALRARSH
jgi:hypothetical protein